MKYGTQRESKNKLRVQKLMEHGTHWDRNIKHSVVAKWYRDVSWGWHDVRVLSSLVKHYGRLNCSDEFNDSDGLTALWSSCWRHRSHSLPSVQCCVICYCHELVTTRPARVNSKQEKITRKYFFILRLYSVPERPWQTPVPGLIPSPGGPDESAEGRDLLVAGDNLIMRRTVLYCVSSSHQNFLLSHGSN